MHHKKAIKLGSTVTYRSVKTQTPHKTKTKFSFHRDRKKGLRTKFFHRQITIKQKRSARAMAPLLHNIYIDHLSGTEP